jgi:DNA-binding response OmpR family regulator
VWQILILETYPPLRRVLTATLERAGWRVAMALSACEALRVLDQHACDALLVDMDPASKEIWDVLRAIRTRNSPMPVVALLSAGNGEWKELEAVGVRVILPKPVSREALLRGITLALRTAGKVP